MLSVFTGRVDSPRSPSDEACCVRMDLAVKPRTDTCVSPVLHTQYLLLGSTDSIYCPSLGCHSNAHDASSPEVTWYRVSMAFPKLV